MKFSRIFALAIMIILLSIFLLHWSNRPVVASSGVSGNLQNVATSNTTSSTTSTVSTSNTTTSTQRCVAYCTVTFTESGLPSGTDWQVTFGSSVQTATSSMMSFQYVTPGNYSWSIQSPIDGSNLTRYEASQSSGTMNVNAQTNFAAKFVTQYQVSFYVSPSVDGWTSPSGIFWYNSTTPLSINATAFSGYEFVTWNSSSGISIANLTATSTIAQLSSAGSIIAEFGTANVTTTSITTTTSNSTQLTNSSSTSASTTSVSSALSSTSSNSSTATTTNTTTSVTSIVTTSTSTPTTNSTTTITSSSFTSTTTIEPKSTNIAVLFYTVPYVTTQSPSILGTMIFVTEVGSVMTGLFVVRKMTNKKKENKVEDSGNWSWRW